MKKNYCLAFLCLTLFFALFIIPAQIYSQEKQDQKSEMRGEMNITSRGFPWLHVKRLDSLYGYLKTVASYYDIDVSIDKKEIGWFSSTYYFTFDGSKKELVKFAKELKNIEYCYRKNKPYLIPR